MHYVNNRAGTLELHLSDDLERFVEIANKIQQFTHGVFTQKLDGLDQSYWDITTDSICFTIHREHYLGVSIYSDAPDARKVLDRLTTKLTI